MLDFLGGLFRSISPLWGMSLTAAYAAAIVIVLRLLLKRRAPRQVICLLWLVVFARLLVPLSLESPLSIVPEARPVQEQLYSPRQEAVGRAPANPVTPTAPIQNPAQGQASGTVANPVISNPNPGEPALTLPEGVTPSVTNPEPDPPAFPWQAIAAGVWLAGAVTMGGYGLLSYLRLRRRLFDAIRAQDGAWEHPAVDSPFILGILRPRIYLPAGLVGQPRTFILCHERAHMRRLDHIIKPVCWVALALHWFNPLVWAAFILMSRDIEAACDEAVLRRLGNEVKADYSYTLLALATRRRAPAPCPLAFDEGDAKGRIKNVLRYRRPALWVIVVSVVMAVVAAVCLLTDPVAAQNLEDGPDPGASSSLSPDAVLDPWMKEVLDGERTFVSPYSAQAYYMNDLRAFFYGDDQNLDREIELERLAVIDLDRDGVNEMVVWPAWDQPDPTMQLVHVTGYLILHRQGDEIYGASLGYRGFGCLKSDGTFSYSSGAADWGYGTLRFTQDGKAETVDNITYCKAAENGSELYFVDGRKATREDFEAASSWQELKPDPAWYTYDGGLLQPYLPAGSEAVCATADDPNGPTLWLEGGEYPWLEWRGIISQLGPVITPAQSPMLYTQDFDGDGQDEVLITYFLNGFLKLDLYEWNNGQLIFADSYDSEDLLLRFNQNNVAGYNKDSRGLTVTYAHTEGDPDSDDYYRHYVTGSCTLPEDFFDGYEQIRDGYTYVYANEFSQFWIEGDAFCFKFDFCLADETMQELNRVDTLLNSDHSLHYMVDKNVGYTAFTLRYDGAKWVLQEPDQLDMAYQDENGPSPAPEPTAQPTAEPTAAPTPTSDPLPTVPATPQPGLIAHSVAPFGELTILQAQDGYNYLVSVNGRDYPVDPSITSDNLFLQPWIEDLDGDGSPEALFSCYQLFTVYDVVGGQLVSHSFDWNVLYADFSRNTVAGYRADTGEVTVTYSWGALNESTRRYLTAHTVLPDSFFEGCEALKDDPLTAVAQPHAIQGTNGPNGGFWYRLNIHLTNGTVTSPTVGHVDFEVFYTNGGFVITVLDMTALDMTAFA